MKSRDLILERVSQSLKRREADADLIAKQAASLLSEPERGRPALPAGDLVTLFAEQATLPRIGATVQLVRQFADVPHAVRSYLEAEALSGLIALEPDAALLSLDWQDVEYDSASSADQLVAVQKALWGIAETGTLVFHSSATCPTLFSFLPLHHIVVLEAKNILPYLDDYADLASGVPVPRNANLITGPSGTTDIEGTLVRGAHGPGFLHIILVEM